VNTFRRGARAFGHFWWDFLVGDTPELFFATAALVVAAFLLRHHHLVAVVVLPLLVIVSLIASVLRARAADPQVPPPTSTDMNDRS
jgi:hypothetical protein